MRAAKLNAVGWTAVFALSLGGLASAQTATTGHWTVDSAETVGAGNNVVRGQVGFPGLWADIIHGVDPTLEIGGRLQLNYGVEGLTDATHFEMALNFLLRKQFVDNGKFKFAGTFNPGILFYTAFSTTTFGITFPVEGQFGIPIDPKVTLNASFGLPMWVTFGSASAFYLPIMFGGGVEYLLEPHIAVTGKVKVGPTFITNGGGTQFTLYVLAGVAYKF